MLLAPLCKIGMPADLTLLLCEPVFGSCMKIKHGHSLLLRCEMMVIISSSNIDDWILNSQILAVLSFAGPSKLRSSIDCKCNADSGAGEAAGSAEGLGCRGLAE